MKPTVEQLAEWARWLEGRPAAVRDVAERYPPWTFYRLTTTNQLGQILAYGEGEDGGVTVRMVLCREGAGVLAPLMTREVFGIDPRDLEATESVPDYMVGVEGES